jgi:hypothetical protein
MCIILEALIFGVKIFSPFVAFLIRVNVIIQGAAFDVTHFESRITHLLYTTINTTEHG